MTPPRGNHRRPWGTVAPRVREALLADGVVEAAVLAEQRSLDQRAVLSALKRAEASGQVVRVFRGVYALPDVAAEIAEVVRMAKEGRGR